jgi:predicted acyltransferase
MNKERLDSIDQFRGFAIFAMVLANYMADCVVVPSWLKHAPDIGLTVIDLIAPFFIFAIGLTYGPSLSRRISAGTPGRVAGHFFRRFLTLIGLGAIISAGEVALGQSTSVISWGVLQAIGAAGIVTLPALLLPPKWRVLVGITVLAGYQALLDASWLPIVLHSSHGGIHGALSWSGMLIVATAIGDDALLQGRSEWRLVIWSILALGAGIALAAFLPELAPVSKNRVSASYVLLSVGASGLLFAGFRVLVDRFRVRVPFLSGWGKNPLLLYLLHYLLLGLFVLPGVAWWHTDAPALLVAAQAVVLVGMLSFIAWALEKRKIVVSL